tara:strand:+ start:143 stop:610 length:468 start_codon:yes stop_codon:yes gene_type:complete
MSKQLIYLKLVSGEDLIGYVEELDDTHVRVTKPLRASLIDNLRGTSSVRLEPWLIVNRIEDSCIINENKIVTFTKPAPEYVAFYKDAIQNLEEKIQFKDILNNFDEGQIEEILQEIDNIRQDPDAQLDQELMSLEDALSEVRYKIANTNFMKTVH